MGGRSAVSGCSWRCNLGKYLLGLLALVMMPPAKADSIRPRPPVVVELFTSQGCAYCPDADSLLGKLAAREGVIGLSWHVDHWDYLGWRDPFAKPEFSRRQKSYARQHGARMVYTPQMIINGGSAVNGNRPEAVVMEILRRSAHAHPIELQVERRDNQLLIDISGQASEPADVFVVRYLPRRATSVLRGENAGRKLVHHNVVTRWQKVAAWPGNVTMKISEPLDDSNEALLVLIQGVDGGPILASRRLR